MWNKNQFEEINLILHEFLDFLDFVQESQTEISSKAKELFKGVKKISKFVNCLKKDYFQSSIQNSQYSSNDLQKQFQERIQEKTFQILNLQVEKEQLQIQIQQLKETYNDSEKQPKIKDSLLSNFSQDENSVSISEFSKLLFIQGQQIE